MLSIPVVCLFQPLKVTPSGERWHNCSRVISRYLVHASPTHTELLMEGGRRRGGREVGREEVKAGDGGRERRRDEKRGREGW